MKKYIIPKLNGQDEITPDRIEIAGLSSGKILNVNLYPLINKVSLGVYLITTKTKLYHYLENIQVLEMRLDDGSLLQSQVETALDEQFLVIE